MKLPRFINLPEYNKFEYKPVYYDKRKEALEQKIKKYKDQKEAVEKGDYKPEFKGKFKSSYRRDITKKQKKAANIRFLILLIFFGTVTYIILQKTEIISYMFNILFSG